MEKIVFKLKDGESFIPLIQLLKVAQVVQSGGEAQEAVTQGLVKRNNTVETRKRAKITAGETIRFAAYEIAVVQ